MNASNQPLPCAAGAESAMPLARDALIGEDFDATAGLLDQPLPGTRTPLSVGEALLSQRFVLPRAA